MSETSPLYDSGPRTEELPKFACIKDVRAFKIGAIEVIDGGREFAIHPEDAEFKPVKVPPDWINSRKPAVGGYFVVYDEGAYTSYSPAEVFEAGYIPLGQFGVVKTQEPKYGITRRGQFYNRATGRVIPPEVPTMLLIGWDLRALPAIITYHDSVRPEHRGSSQERILAFSAFKETYPERMKEPDGRPKPPPEPSAAK